MRQYLVDEEEEMSITSVHMRLNKKRVRIQKGSNHSSVFITFNTQSTNLIEVIAIQVSVYPEQSTDNGFDSVPEVPRERHTWIIIRILFIKHDPTTKELGGNRTYLIGKYDLIVQNTLCPVHQRINVLRCW